jgi:hypothetical protein
MGSLAPRVARVNAKLNTSGARREGVFQHQQLSLGIDGPPVNAPLDGLDHPLGRRRATGDVPIFLESFAHWVNWHNGPRPRIAVDREANLLLQLRRERLQPHEPAFQWAKGELHRC